MKQYAVVVDPLGNGQEYPFAFRQAGVEPVAVLATPEPPRPYRPSWHPENFEHIHAFDGDLEKLAAQLRAYDPICLIAGAESGVELAERLVELVVPGTGHKPGLEAARRDKWAMAQAVRAAGVELPRQIASDDPDAIDRWLRETGLDNERIVVKPPKSAGTDDVHIVPRGAQWRPYFDQIYGKINDMGVRNDAVLVQEFAEGTEFLIDSYSVDGRHGLVDVCRYTKLQRGDLIGIYDLVDFLRPDDPDVQLVWPYVQRVLDALGIRNGSGHTEVIVTKDGPRLLEVAARQAGGGHQMITKLATGANHITRTIDHRVHGTFDPSYELQQYVCSVVINSPREGIWRNAEIFADVESLPTFHAKQFLYGTGDRVPAPAIFATFIGWVVLASTDRAALEADYQHLKRLEAQLEIDPVELATRA